MPGIATQFEILRLTITKLDAAGDPNGVAAAMKANSAYAHLGAIGPLLGDFLPSDPFPLEQEFPDNYPTLWRRLFHLVGRKDLPGLYHILGELEDLLDAIQPLADAENCEGLKALADSGVEERIDEATADFARVLGAIQSEAIVIAGIIGEGLRPAVTTENPGDPVPPPKEWQMQNILHWKRSGQFVRSLLDVAQAEGDARLLAYSYGYAVGYAGHVCGNGFVNSIVGGPTRTQWWRQRFVRNYVDAWVYGHYNTNPRPTVDDNPVPPYSAWPNLCTANLQDRIKLQDLDPAELMDLAARVQPFPDVIPDDFAQNWFKAMQNVYGQDLPADVDAGSFNSAYLFTWLVLWFQTSGQVMGCDRQVPLTPPDDCGSSPTELDPFLNGVPTDGTVPEPPDASIDYDIDELAIICAIILAIIGGLLFYAGAIGAGGAAIAGALALLDCDSIVDLDWKQLRCLLYWQRMFLHNAIKGVHRLLTLAALEYPYARELEVDTDFGDLFPFLEPWESGRQLCSSKINIRFPGIAWDGSLLTFNRPPANLELPRTIAYQSAAYPVFFIDDAATNPLTAGNDVKTDTPAVVAADGGRHRVDGLGSQAPAQFGNAVDNAVDLVSSLGANPPDWNLDNDRGLAYFAWHFRDGYDPANVQIDPDA